MDIGRIDRPTYRLKYTMKYTHRHEGMHWRIQTSGQGAKFLRFRVKPYLSIFLPFSIKISPTHEMSWWPFMLVHFIHVFKGISSLGSHVMLPFVWGNLVYSEVLQSYFFVERGNSRAKLDEGDHGAFGHLWIPTEDMWIIDGLSNGWTHGRTDRRKDRCNISGYIDTYRGVHPIVWMKHKS